MKVSVKGSSDGGWIIHARYKTGPKVSYRQALDAWLAAQPLQVVFFYVQFYGVPFGDMPRCYVARAADVYAHMLTTRGGHIAGSLVERYAYSRRGAGAGTTDTIPPSWELTEARLDAV